MTFNPSFRKFDDEALSPKLCTCTNTKRQYKSTVRLMTSRHTNNKSKAQKLAGKLTTK